MGAQTNYQVKFILSNSTGTSGYYAPDNIIYTNGLTRPDWADINATDGSGNPIPFWVENRTYTATNATAWANVPSIAVGNTSTGRWYYGDSSQTVSTAKGLDTFILFDDFDAAAMNVSQIDKNTGASYTVSNSVITITGSASTTNWVRGVSAFPTNVSGVMRIKPQQTDKVSDPGFRDVADASDASSVIINEYWSDGYSYPAAKKSGGSGTTSATYAYNSAYHIMEYQWANNYVACLDNGVIKMSNASSSVVPTGSMYFFLEGQKNVNANGLWDIDWVIVRKFVSVEPTTSEYSTYSTSSPPVSNFTKNTTQVYSPPYTLQFNDTSTGTPTTWNWTFGDGDTSTSQNATHTYASSGVYSVSLNVTNTVGFSNTSKSNFVVIPDYGYDWSEITSTAAFKNWSAGSVVVLNDVMYMIAGIDETSDYLGTVYSSSDGVTWTLLNSSAFVGRHANVAVAYDNKIWSIGGYEGPVPGYVDEVWSSPDGIIWTLNTDAAAFGRIVRPVVLNYNNAMWVIGGDTQGGAGVLNDVYTSTDGATWTLVNGSCPWTQRYTHGGTVFENKMWIWGGTATTSSATALKDVWYSSDGNIWTQATPDAGFGRYSASLIEFGGLMWTFGGSSGNIAPYTYYGDLHFSKDGVTWYNTSYINHPNNATESGFVNMSNRMYISGGVADVGGIGAPTVFSSEPILQELVSSFTQSAIQGTTPLTVTFTDTTTGYPAATSWNWTATNVTPGNNTPFIFSTSQSPTQVFRVGNFAIQHGAASPIASNISTQVSWVNVSQMVASFTGTPTSGTVPFTVNFTGSSTGSPTSWLWEFGDGYTSTEQNPSHFYNTTGTFNVNFMATNTSSGAFDWENKTGYISTTPMVASFSGTPTSGSTPLAVTFSGSSTGSPNA
jgi:PKD repeat protein